MVVVHNYSESQKQLGAPDHEQPNNIDEDRAYVVGIWVFAVFVAIVIVFFVLFAISRNQGSEEVAANNETTSQEVAGEKETTKTDNQTQTEMKEETTTKEDVTELERPLTDEEIIAKAEKIPGSQIHTVEPGESLYIIGEKYGVDWHQIAELTNLSAPYNLHTGQKLIIPSKGGNE